MKHSKMIRRIQREFAYLPLCGAQRCTLVAIRCAFVAPSLTGCGKTQKTEADFRVRSVNARHDCSDCGIGTALEQGFGRVLGIGAQYGHGYAAAPNSLGRRTGCRRWR